MTITNTLLVRVVLAVVSCIFVWFGVGELFPAAEDGAKLLSVGAVGFALAAIILP